MSAFKVLGIKAVLENRTTPKTYIDGFGTGDAVPGISAARLGLMSTVLSMTDCYWTEDRALTTDPFTDLVPELHPELAAGEVRSWEIKIPASGAVELFLNFVSEHEPDSSGDSSVIRKKLELENEEVFGVLTELLLSPYLVYENGDLRNTDNLSDVR